MILIRSVLLAVVALVAAIHAQSDAVTSLASILQGAAQPSASRLVPLVGTYVCLDAQRMLCLGISTSETPVYNPDNLYKLQVKRREKNELRGLDFLKMRWTMDPITEGKVRLANFTSLCLARMSRDDPREVVLRPCMTQQFPELLLWNVPFSGSTTEDSETTASVSDPLAAPATGKIALRSNPALCLTMMKCGVTPWGGCSPDMNDPLFNTDVPNGAVDSSAMSGAYVKLAPCIKELDISQTFRQISNCSPGCSTLLMENNRCDEVCQTAACNWDNGFCPEITSSPVFSPTFSPTRKPTTGRPSKTPTRSPSVSRPTTSPTKKPTATPTKSPSTTGPTSSPTFNPTVQPTSSPTASPTVQPSQAPTGSPTTSSPTSSPTVAPSSSPTFAPTPQNVSDLGAVPVNVTEPAPWWAWLILAVCLILLTVLIGLSCFYVDRRRREQREREEAEERQRLAQKNAGVSPPAPPAPQQEQVEVDLERGPELSLMDSSMLPEPPVNEYFVEKTRKDEEDARARRATRRTVISLINAMSELESSFTAVEKEISGVVSDNSSLNESSSSIKGVLKQSELASMEKREAKDLALEVKSTKLNAAISNLESAIFKLERKVGQEKLKGVTTPRSRKNSENADTESQGGGSGGRSRKVSFASDCQRDGMTVDTENDYEMQDVLGYMLSET